MRRGLFRAVLGFVTALLVASVVAALPAYATSRQWSVAAVDQLLVQLQSHPFVSATAPLARFSLSPGAPLQGDRVTVFVDVEVGFEGPRPVRVFASVSIDGRSVPLLHPSEKLFTLDAGTFLVVGEHRLEAQFFLENPAESELILSALTALNRESLSLGSGPVRAQQREELERALQDLRRPIGTEEFRFFIGANTNPGSGFPRVVSVEPNFGAREQATEVFIHGVNFTSGSRVFVGGTEASQVDLVDSATLRARIPGLVDRGPREVEVRVPHLGGELKALLPNGFFVTDGGGGSSGNLHPVAFAGLPQVGKYVDEAVQLDGSLSYDDNGDPLLFRWFFYSKPMGSALSDAAIQAVPGDHRRAAFVPDVSGVYGVALVVSDGALESVPSLTTVATSRQVKIVFDPPSMLFDARVTGGVSWNSRLVIRNNADTESLTLTDVVVSGNLLGEIVFGDDSMPGGPMQGALPTSGTVLAPGESWGVDVRYSPKVESIGTEQVVNVHIFGRNSHLTDSVFSVTTRAHKLFPLQIVQRVPHVSEPYVLAGPGILGGGRPSSVIPNALDQDVAQELWLKNLSSEEVTIHESPVLVPMGNLNSGRDGIPWLDPVPLPLTLAAGADYRLTVHGATSGSLFSEALFRWDMQLLPFDFPLEFGVLGFRGGYPSMAPFAFMPTRVGQSAIGSHHFAIPSSYVLYEGLSVTLVGPGADQFSLVVDNVGGATFPLWFGIPSMPNGTFPIPTADPNFRVTFHPDRVGTFEAVLRVELSGFSQPFETPLTGQAIVGHGGGMP